MIWELESEDNVRDFFLDQLKLLMMKLHVFFITIAWTVAHARNAIFVAQYSNKRIRRSG